MEEGVRSSQLAAHRQDKRHLWIADLGKQRAATERQTQWRAGALALWIGIMTRWRARSPVLLNISNTQSGMT